MSLSRLHAAHIRSLPPFLSYGVCNSVHLSPRATNPPPSYPDPAYGDRKLSDAISDPSSFGRMHPIMCPPGRLTSNSLVTRLSTIRMTRSSTHNIATCICCPDALFRRPYGVSWRWTCNPVQCVRFNRWLPVCHVKRICRIGSRK